MKTKVDVFSGFLGAGKTTLIKKLLSESLHSEKIIIIENEFGEIGIDGTILKNSNVEIKEINSGCICCTLVGDFKKAIEEIISKYTPDRIIIEPSGVGKLSDVINACSNDKLKDLLKLNMIITVVDVLNYELYLENFGEFYKNQIKTAKTILLTRVEKSVNKNLELVIESLIKLNPKATVITTQIEKLHSNIIINAAEEDAAFFLETNLKASTKMTINSSMHRYNRNCQPSYSHNHNANEIFQVWSTITPKVYVKKDLEEMLNTIFTNKDLGIILRAKGILQIENEEWVKFDYVPGEFEIKPISPDYTGKVCIIGENLNKDTLTKFFKISTETEV